MNYKHYKNKIMLYILVSQSHQGVELKRKVEDAMPSRYGIVHVRS